MKRQFLYVRIDDRVKSRTTDQLLSVQSFNPILLHSGHSAERKNSEQGSSRWTGESWTPGTEPSDIPYNLHARWDLEQPRPQTSDLIASDDGHASNLIAQNHQFRHREIQMQTELQSLEDTIRNLQVKQDNALQQKDTKIASLEQDIIIRTFAHSNELRDRGKQTRLKLKSLEETIRSLRSRTQCPICYGDAGWIVACGHMFCRGCVDVWKAENEVFQCPICRKLCGGGYPMFFTT